jgi:hypothetical protein
LLFEHPSLSIQRNVGVIIGDQVLDLVGVNGLGFFSQLGTEPVHMLVHGKSLSVYAEYGVDKNAAGLRNYYRRCCQWIKEATLSMS